LIDFVNKLGDADINDSICSEKEREDVINAFKACVVYRNKNSAEGINGMALAFPYKSIDLYPNNEAELTKLSFKKERKLFNDIFSVIAYQKKVEYEAAKSDKEHRISSFIKTLLYVDYTKSDWYVKGFEDYAPDTTLIDIPVTETTNGWKIELPEKTWQIIADCKTSVLQKADDGSYRYLGWDYVSDVDESGHPMVDMDDMWVHVGDQLVYYEGKKALETEDGVIFTGDTKARLNKKDDIILHIEWDPAQGEDVTATGHITGYDFIDDESSTMSKGTHVLSTGDSIQFLFDYYDENGKLLRTAPSDSRIIVTKMDDLKVEDRPLEDCDIAFMGVLTDVYQRELLTEIIEAHIGD
jgi:hypothetical protein